VSGPQPPPEPVREAAWDSTRESARQGARARRRASRGRTPRDPLGSLIPSGILSASSPSGVHPRAPGEGEPPVERVDEVVRWAACGCARVPLVLLVCGSSPGVAAGTAVGLAAVTAVCRALLRHCERITARSAAERAGPHRGRHSRTGTGAHRGGRGQR